LRRQRIPIVVLAVAVLGPALSGCALRDEGPRTGTINVSMRDIKFDPMELTIQAGATVRWTNRESIPHDVTAADGSWNSTGGPGGMDFRDAYERTFPEPGTFDYYCTVHSTGPGNGMWGRVEVVA
jgi:plastocyanin